MKFFYKICMYIVIAMAVISCTSLLRPIIAVGATVSAERLEVKNTAFNSLRELTEKTNNGDSKKILHLLETKSVMVTPTDEGFYDSSFVEEPDKIHLVVLTREDASLRYWGPMFSTADTFAIYFPKRNVIVLKQMDSFSSFIGAILIDHEGYHALFFQSNDRNEKATNMQMAEREKDNYEHGAVLFSAVGGEKYKVYMTEEMKRIDELVKSSSSKKELPYQRIAYDEKLDAIFGVAKSDPEKKARMAFTYVFGIFQYIDEYYTGTQAEKETAKTKVLFEAYEKMRNSGRL